MCTVPVLQETMSLTLGCCSSTHLERVRPPDGDDDGLPVVVDNHTVRRLVEAVLEVRENKLRSGR